MALETEEFANPGSQNEERTGQHRTAYLKKEQSRTGIYIGMRRFCRSGKEDGNLAKSEKKH